MKQKNIATQKYNFFIHIIPPIVIISKIYYNQNYFQTLQIIIYHFQKMELFFIYIEKGVQ